jgi:thymidylate synthase ThyX
MKKIEAKVIADSITEQGNRATTFVLTFPRYILAELNTHRLFSKNSASSRAIPFNKMVEMVEEDPFIPIAWQKDHKGMQGTEYFDEKDLHEKGHVNEGHAINKLLKRDWILARNKAVESAKDMNERGCTKQLVNRLLEPFMWHTVVLTSTEFENFFEQRCPQYYIDDHAPNTRIIAKSWKELCKKDKKYYEYSIIDRLKHNKGQGEIHMMELAECMYDALNESEPKKLAKGEYHLPFGDNIKGEELVDLTSDGELADILDVGIRVCVARCARASYNNFDGDSDVAKDIALYEKLVVSKPGHYSPTEHVLKAMSEDEFFSYYNAYVVEEEELSERLEEEFNNGTSDYTKRGTTYFVKEYGWCRNMRGFIQHRVEIGG